MRNGLLSLLFFVLSLVNGAFAQISWLPLDENLNVSPIATFGSGGNYFALQSVSGIGFRQSTLKLSKWNGQFWIHYPSTSVQEFVFSTDNKSAVTFHQNEPYISGSFGSDDKLKTGILKWDGTTWQTVAGGIESDYSIHNEISISDMVSYQNNLFVCGQFNIAGGKPVHNFVVLQSGTWNNIDTKLGAINDLHLINDTLFAAGSFNELDGKASNNIAANYNGVWYPVNSPNSNEIKALSTYNTGLVAITKQQVFLRNFSGWQLLSNQWNYEVINFGSAAEFEGKLYLAGTFKSSLGQKSHLLVWDGVKWQSLVNEFNVLPKSETQYFINSRDKELIFSGKISSFFGKEVSNVIRLLPGKTIVKGKIYLDNAKNCVIDSDDKPLENAILNLNDSFYTSTDALGNYSLVLDQNQSCRIKIFPGDNYSSNCQIETFQINTSNRDSAIQVDFPLTLNPKPASPTVEIISASGFKARHGFLASYTIQHQAANEFYPLEVELSFDKRLSYINSNTEPIYQDSSFLKWLLKKDEKVLLNFMVNHDKIDVGDNLQFILNGYSSSFPRKTPETNVLNQIVTSAFDPNEKQCNKYEIEEGENQLNYHIQFQNLGNDSAVNIHIVDTIDKNLPIQFIKMQEYSETHQTKLSYKVRNRAIIWSFKDIYLPSKSISNDAASSGYLAYNTFMEPTLKPGNVISNQAAIYFDYQDPVITNKVETKVIKRTISTPHNRGNLTVYPNPSEDGNISLAFYPYLIKKVEVFDMTGRKLYTKEIQPAANTQISIPNLSKGIYIVNVSLTVGSVSRKFVVK